MSVFNNVGVLKVTDITMTGFTVSWNVPDPPYPVPLHNFDIPVCLGPRVGSVFGPIVQRWVPGASRRIFNIGGLAPGTTYTVGIRAQGAGGTNSSQWQTITIRTPATSVSADQVAVMRDFMMKQLGKPYTQVNPTRFGPTAYDCSGLVWAAAVAADIPMPQSLSTAEPEMAYFADQIGAYIIPGIPELEAGDIVGCTGAIPGPVTIGGHTYQVGHIGVMADSTNLVSALNTKLGVAVMNVSFLSPQIAIRAQGR